jgi:putative hydrolase of the HAD superfamily
LKVSRLQFDAVFFDLFDTLVLMGDEAIYYPSALKKLHQSLVKNGLKISYEDFKDAYFKVRDKFYSDSMQSLEEPHFNLRVSETLKKLGYSFESDNSIVRGATAAFSKEFVRFARLDDEAIPVLQKLCVKYKLGLVSNLSIPEAGWEILRKLGLKSFFKVVVISGEVNRRKPSREVFNKALRALDVEASKTVFVGDTLNVDVKGAKNCGMKAILLEKNKPLAGSSYVWKAPATEKIAEPDKTIATLRELVSVLEDWRTTYLHEEFSERNVYIE